MQISVAHARERPAKIFVQNDETAPTGAVCLRSEDTQG